MLFTLFCRKALYGVRNIRGTTPYMFLPHILLLLTSIREDKLEFC